MHNSKTPIIPSCHEAFDLLFGIIIVGRHIRVFEEARDFRPLRRRVRQRLAQRTLRRNARQQFIHPLLERRQERLRFVLPQFQGDLERQRLATARVLFPAVS